MLGTPLVGRWQLKLAGCHKFWSFFLDGFPREHRCTDSFTFFYLKYFFSGGCHWDQVSFLFCTRTSLMKVCVENLESQLPVLGWLFAELKVWWTVVLWEQRWEKVFQSKVSQVQCTIQFIKTVMYYRGRREREVFLLLAGQTRQHFTGPSVVSLCDDGYWIAS